MEHENCYIYNFADYIENEEIEETTLEEIETRDQALLVQPVPSEVLDDEEIDEEQTVEIDEEQTAKGQPSHTWWYGST